MITWESTRQNCTGRASALPVFFFGVLIYVTLFIVNLFIVNFIIVYLFIVIYVM